MRIQVLKQDGVERLVDGIVDISEKEGIQLTRENIKKTLFETLGILSPEVLQEQWNEVLDVYPVSKSRGGEQRMRIGNFFRNLEIFTQKNIFSLGPVLGLDELIGHNITNIVIDDKRGVPRNIRIGVEKYISEQIRQVEITTSRNND